MVACGGTNNSSSSASIGAVAVGEIDPLSGRLAGIGERLLHGQQTAVEEINSNGGILGVTVAQYSVDDAGDSVDAVPAMRQLLTHHITYVSGPSSPTFDAVQPLIDQAKVVDFGNLPSSKYDALTDPWVFRQLASDTVLGTAMAYYAINKGYTKCSMMFENVDTAQTLIAPIKNAYTKHGGQIVDSETLVPHAVSYRTELEKAFAPNPQCVFIQTDPTTTGTLWSNARELGLLKVPFVGTDVYVDPDVAKAAGLADFSKLAVGFLGSNPSGPAFDHFATIFKTKYGTAPDNFAAANYDGIIVGALAIVAAKSSDPAVWVNKVTAVSSTGGTECSTYKDCVTLLQQGKRISYVGASGPFDFDSHHGRFTGFDALQSDSSANFHSIQTITADQLKSFA